MAGGAPKGNTNGKRGTIFRDTLMGIIRNEASTLPEDRQRLRRAALQLLSQAADGEEWAIKELANRVDGKAIQGVEITGKEGSNFFDPAQLRNLSPEEAANLKALLKKAAAAGADDEDPEAG